MVLMIKTEPVQHTVKWEIKRRRREGKEKEGEKVREEGGQRNQNKATRARACWEDNLH